jgi:hypothetical protein
LREKADKAVKWLDWFMQVGDVASHADPVHIGFPMPTLELIALRISPLQRCGSNGSTKAVLTGHENNASNQEFKLFKASFDRSSMLLINLESRLVYKRYCG